MLSSTRSRFSLAVILLIVLSPLAGTLYAQNKQENKTAAEKLVKEAFELLNEGSEEAFRKAIKKFESALPLYRSANDRSGEAITLNNIGTAYQGLGEYQQSLNYYNQALSLYREINDRFGEAATLVNIGLVYSHQGEKQNALRFFNQTLHLLQAIENRNKKAAMLNNIGMAFEAVGEKRKALELYSQALSLNQALGDRRSEAFILNKIGAVYYALSENHKALEVYEKLLSLLRAIKDQRGEAVALSEIGTVYEAMGEMQKALQYYYKSLPLRRIAGDPEGEALTLDSIGDVYYALGTLQKALEHYNQALPLYRALNDHDGEAGTLNGIGLVYEALGKTQESLEYHNQALRLYRALNDRPGEAKALTNIGAVYRLLGEMQKALEFFNQALTLVRDIKDHRGEATILNNIGIVYRMLGQRQKALEFYKGSLFWLQAIGNRREEAITLSNIGAVYRQLGQVYIALEFYNRALSLNRALRDRRSEALTLNNIGGAYVSLGEKQKALEFYTQSLSLSRAVEDRNYEATTLNNIGGVYNSLGENQKALEFLNQALPLFRAVGNRDGEAETLNSMMSLWKSLDKTAIAIFYGKQAVNIYQQLRANIQGLDKESQKSFLSYHGDTYRELADLLIARGRLPEAQQVLDMLKEEEFFEFVRRDPQTASLSAAHIAFTPAEVELEKRFNEIIDRIVAIGSERSALLSKQSRTPAEETLLAQREDDLIVANQAFQKFLDQLDAELKKDKPGSKDVFYIREAQSLKNTLREIHAVALYTIVGKDYYRLILITPDAEKAYEYAIKGADLNRKIFAFRQRLQNPGLDPLPQAQELYRILIGPTLARDLIQTKTQTLMWSLDGALRYLPIAALHDGRTYMVESYRSVVFTPASRDHLKDLVSSKWQALGLGVSKEHTLELEPKAPVTFPALPGVREELEGIIRNEAGGARAKGVLGGKMMMDEAFTERAMRSALQLRGNEQPYHLVHIASHFSFQPGDETKSFLLLGDGTALTLAQLKTLPHIFSKVELLTLSACNTATGGEGAEGIEVDGFAMLAQRQGAEAIIASLWPVIDPSTSQLMREFYRLRSAGGGMPKAEALRQAQMALLRGQIAETTQNKSNRSKLASGAGKNSAAPAFTPGPKAPYAHPYFWAPFIMIGNWR